MADKYLAIIEQATDGSYSGYFPDVPGCVSCGDSVEELEANLQEALDFHFEGIGRAGLPIPAPASKVEFICAMG